MNVSGLDPLVVATEEFSYFRNQFVPEISGCYVLTNFSGEIFYIGKTVNLRTRMYDHLNDPEKNVNTILGKVTKFHYKICEERFLDSLERGWINEYELRHGGLPPFNKIRPSSG